MAPKSNTCRGDCSYRSARFRFTADNFNGYAGTTLTVLEEVYDSEYETAFGNRAIANLLFNARS